LSHEGRRSDFNGRKRDVVVRHYGLNRGNKGSLQKIADHHNRSKERMRIDEEQAFKDLRKSGELKVLCWWR